MGQIARDLHEIGNVLWPFEIIEQRDCNDSNFVESINVPFEIFSSFNSSKPFRMGHEIPFLIDDKNPPEFWLKLGVQRMIFACFSLRSVASFSYLKWQNDGWIGHWNELQLAQKCNSDKTQDTAVAALCYPVQFSIRMSIWKHKVGNADWWLRDWWSEERKRVVQFDSV